MARVLCIENDTALTQTRKLILERAGHKVAVVQEQAAIVAACREHYVAVAVLGQSLAAKKKRATASAIRHHSPSTKILELYTANQTPAIKGADLWLLVPPEVPEDLARQVTQLAKSSGPWFFKRVV